MQIRGDFRINNQAFSDWFNGTFRLENRTHFPYPVRPEGFENVMNHLEKLSGKTSISLAEFCGHFAIIYNETGGRFETIREMGGPKYIFEPNRRGKISYNTAKLGNRLAGDLLQARGVISEAADVAAWNSQKYPGDARKSVRKAAKNCDFYKYRGGGFNQLTWRKNYKACLQPLVNQDIDEMTDTQITELLEDTGTACAVFHNFISLNPEEREAIEALSRADFAPYGMLVSGNWTSYVNKYYLPRCRTLYSALQKTENRPAHIYSIDGLNLNRAQIKKLQFLCLQYASAEKKKFMLDKGGADGAWGPATENVFSSLRLGIDELLLKGLADSYIKVKELDKSEIRLIQRLIMNSDNSKAAALVRNSGGADGIWGRKSRLAFAVLTKK